MLIIMGITRTPALFAFALLTWRQRGMKRFEKFEKLQCINRRTLFCNLNHRRWDRRKLPQKEKFPCSP